MIKFEEHDDNLFRMLEEPVPLTDDAELPVLVRMIQDDTMLGKANKRSYHPDTLAEKIICSSSKLTDDGLFMDGNYTYCYEIIGTLVEEGSKDWALHQMMQGNKVINSNSTVFLTLTDDRIVRIDDSVSWDVGHWLRIFDDTTGWQIYKEPKPEPKPKPIFKVGDWVEVECQNKLYHKQVLFVTENRVGFEFSGTTPSVCFDGTPSHIFKFIRKLSPSEVIVHIGCLSGTIRYYLSFDNDGAKHDAIRIFNSNGKSIAVIHLEALDTETRELVESLLEAMREDE